MLSDFVLNSDQLYPPIIREGSTAYSVTTGFQSFALTDIEDNEDYLVFMIESGEVKTPAFYNHEFNGTSTVYKSGGVLYLYMGDIASRSGVAHWRIYGDRT